MMSRDKALELLAEQGVVESLLHHSFQSEAVLQALANHLNEDKELWAMTGLLHDVDFFHTANSPEKHGIMVMGILKDYLPENALYAIKAHNSEYTGCAPISSFDYALRAGETVTGLIYTASLVRPEGFNRMTPKSIKKKMKDKAFAASVSRENIRECENLGIDLDTFLTLSIHAMASV